MSAQDLAAAWILWESKPTNEHAARGKERQLAIEACRAGKRQSEVHIEIATLRRSGTSIREAVDGALVVQSA